MQGNNRDRRQHPRFEVEQAFYIEVVRRGSHSESDNTIIRCQTLDVSVGGLRVSVPIPIPRGSILNIAVPTGDWKDNLEFVGEAMWIKEAEDGDGYWLGLALKDSSNEDMEKWFELVEQMMYNAQLAAARQQFTDK